MIFNPECNESVVANDSRCSIRDESCVSVCVDTAAGVLHDVKQHAMTIAAMIAMITNATRCAGLFVDVFEFFNFFISFDV